MRSRPAWIVTRAEPAWTFYGRQGCTCCQEAANLLLLLLDGRRVTLRMIDLPSSDEAPATVHRLPALLEAHGLVVWQGAFDSGATERAWRMVGHRSPRPRADERVAYQAEEAEPTPNGLQWMR